MTNKKIQQLLEEVLAIKNKISLESGKENAISSSLYQARNMLRCLEKVKPGSVTHSVIKDINEKLILAANEDIQIAETTLTAQRELVQRLRGELTSICAQISHIESKSEKLLVKFDFNDVSYGDYIQALRLIYESNIGAIKRQCLQTLPGYSHFEHFKSLHEINFETRKFAHVAIHKVDLDALLGVLSNTGFKAYETEMRGKNNGILLELYDDDYLELISDKLGINLEKKEA